MSFELTTLGEYATVEGGFAYKAKDFVNKNDVAVLKIKNIRNGFIDYENTSFIDIDKATLTEKWMTNVGDILISMTGSGPNAPDSLVGRVARVWKDEPKSAINQRIGRLCLKEKKRIDLDFLFYILSQKNIQDFLVTNSTGSANQVNISSKTIESVPCPKVTYIESRKISTVLNLFEKKIRILQETSKTLESIAQSIFKSWFVDFDPVHAKQEGKECAGIDKATADLFPSNFEESDLGLIPTGWEVGAVGKIFTLTMGQSPAGNTYNESGDGVEFYQGRTDFGFRFPSQRIFCNAPTRIAKENDILISVRAPVGDINVALNECCIGRGVSAIRHPKDYQSYALYAMKQLSSKFKVYDGEGTVFGSINKTDFENIKFISPHEKIILAFEKIIEDFDKKIKNNELILRNIVSLRDTLLPRLMSGKVDLSNIEERLEGVA